MVKIGIIGGGGAGLVSAWLLEEDHEVTLFEKESRLGGHANTQYVDIEGETVPVDAGFEFFSDHMFPTYYALLNMVGVELRPYPMTVTVHNPGEPRQTMVLPPWRNGKVIWSMLKPRSLSKMLQFQRVLNKAAHIINTKDKLTTIEEFLEDLTLSRCFKDEFMYPYLLAGWDVEPGTFMSFGAYNVLKYSYLHQPSGLTPVRWLEVVGGTQAYLCAVQQSFKSVDVKLSTPVTTVKHTGECFIVRDHRNHEYVFDRIVMATNAAQAADVLEPIAELKELVMQLRRITYFKTTIAIHGDTSLMPQNRKHWSIVNFRYDGHYCENTVWKPWRSQKDVFRSWITYRKTLPEPLYATVIFDHPWADRAYFETQDYVTHQNGQGGVWLAGLHTYDEDSHESAICSGVRVAEKLSPDSNRLKRLFLTSSVNIL